jgi:hypothetical protein
VSTRDQIATPDVLHAHGDTHCGAEVPGEARPGEAAHLRDLDAGDVKSVVALRPHQIFSALQTLVELEGLRRAAAHRQAVGVTIARLLEDIVEIPRGFGDTDSLVAPPAPIGVADDEMLGALYRNHRTDALDVVLRLAADLELHVRVSLAPGVFGRGAHVVGILLGQRKIHGQGVVLPPAQQRVHGKTRGLPENVVAGHIERGLHVRMSLERAIHAAVDGTDTRRILADQSRCDDADPGADAFRIGR